MELSSKLKTFLFPFSRYYLKKILILKFFLANYWAQFIFSKFGIWKIFNLHFFQTIFNKNIIIAKVIILLNIVNLFFFLCKIHAYNPKICRLYVKGSQGKDTLLLLMFLKFFLCGDIIWKTYLAGVPSCFTFSALFSKSVLDASEFPARHINSSK